MSFFNNFPDFINLDIRKDRGFSRVTAETLEKRHEVAVPDWLVENMSVLDLGSCLGATGHWALSNGAKHYTGVEAQDKLANTGQYLLSKYWTADKFNIIHQDLREFLDNEIAMNRKYDIVVMIGVIYAFLDTYNILEKVASVCDRALVIDSIFPWDMLSPDDSIIEVCRNQHINSSDANMAFNGAGARVSPAAMRVMMETLGFEDKEGLLYPKPLTDKTVHDTYNEPIDRATEKSYPTPARFMLRFYKTGQTKLRQVTDHAINNNQYAKVKMASAPSMRIQNSWVFDDSVAERFQKEAETHIPDYQRVIDMCLSYTKQVYGQQRDIKLVDVGSALGHTMEKYIIDGYTNVCGIDNSQNMINRSKFKDRTVLSDTFTGSDYDVVLANWTLHFVKERYNYITDIFAGMNHGGLLIISDKMAHTSESETLYLEFKKANGVTESEIQQKKIALMGVLDTKPLSWYFDTLKSIGFGDIQLINSRYMFSTIYARKL